MVVRRMQALLHSLRLRCRGQLAGLPGKEAPLPLLLPPHGEKSEDAVHLARGGRSLHAGRPVISAMPGAGKLNCRST